MNSGIITRDVPTASADDSPPVHTDPEGLTAILDNLDALVYVSTFDTYELLYMNAFGRNIWGSYEGRKCWSVLQNGDGPCSFCSNHLLLDHDGTPKPPHVWEFQNTVDQRWYQCRDQAIRWTDGRLVRMEIATDITDRKNMELALQAARKKAEATALKDDLTRINNRRAFFQFGQQLLHQAKRSQSPLAIIMFDLDHFKLINDGFGHEAGDAVLRHVGQLLRDKGRDSDIAARVGGEEFAILLPDADADHAIEMAHRFSSLFRESPIHYRDQEIRISASFGIALLEPQDSRLEKILSRADEAMYQSKNNGRDQIHLYPARKV
ncbi:GGDEF domain-containing protein [Marinobacter salinexigens]|uniref:diguanylate cyclase n=2 Tax=Marinobacter salinexigens TaxID=2919747 RepID=A0A5B0VJC1_9GAMM|nr:GGDEF domain-containing protein [Marinobacter salinexigens]